MQQIGNDIVITLNTEAVSYLLMFFFMVMWLADGIYYLSKYVSKNIVKFYEDYKSIKLESGHTASK